MYRLWSMCVEMSKENHNNILRNAWNLFLKDVKNAKIGILVALCYLAVMEIVLHNGCPFVVITGFPCPACGLTRAGLHVLRGEWMQALQMNVFIFPIMILAIAAVVRRYFLQKSLKCLVKYTMFLLLCMVLYYIYRMVILFPGQAPMTYYYNNLVHHIVRRMRM